MGLFGGRKTVFVDADILVVGDAAPLQDDDCDTTFAAGDELDHLGRAEGLREATELEVVFEIVDAERGIDREHQLEGDALLRPGRL